MNKLSYFEVSLDDNIKKYSDTLSIARCRIFYKGKNRNGGFVTEQFANKLISSIPYAPIKGIYNQDIEDFEDHGIDNSQGRIYGIVPKDYNLQWEDHLDDDGITRTYATVDVLLYTELYEEAKKITKKTQSMELFPKSIKGKWDFINGEKLFVYEEASFFGLQVLGEDVEPCFEGAAFYSLKNSFLEFVKAMEEYSIKIKQEENNVHINFNLSDQDKFQKIWKSLNTKFNEDGNWTIDYDVVSIYDEYALVVNYENNTTQRVYYTKDNETEEVTIGEIVDCYIVDVTASEKQALNAIHEMNNNTYELADETFKRGAEFTEEKISDFEQKISELETENATLITERDEQKDSFTLQIEELTNRNSEALSQVEEITNNFSQYKTEVENQKKLTIIDKYSKKLSEEIINKYSENLDNYALDSLEEKLALEIIKSEPSLFSFEDNNGLIPKQKSSEWDFLSAYEK